MYPWKQQWYEWDKPTREEYLASLPPNPAWDALMAEVAAGLDAIAAANVASGRRLGAAPSDGSYLALRRGERR